MNDLQQDPSQHPAWSVYDELRTARLNVKCLQCEISELKRFDRGSEMLIALTTTSSAGSFWFLQNSTGADFWKILSGIAVILSIVRPIIKFGEQIQTNEKLLAGYSILDHDLNLICIEIKRKQKYDNAQHKLFLDAMTRKAQLIKSNNRSQIRDSIRLKCEALVHNELPAVAFYIPKS